MPAKPKAPTLTTPSSRSRFLSKLTLFQPTEPMASALTHLQWKELQSQNQRKTTKSTTVTMVTTEEDTEDMDGEAEEDKDAAWEEAWEARA